jgi:hypothetical protein
MIMKAERTRATAILHDHGGGEGWREELVAGGSREGAGGGSRALAPSARGGVGSRLGS